MDNKRLLTIGAILGVILIFLVIIATLIGAAQEKRKEESTRVQKYIQVGQNTRTADPKYYTDPAVKNEIIQNIRERSENLSLENKKRFDSAKVSVPYETRDFAADYFDSMDQFVISEKTEEAPEAARRWLEGNQLSEVDKELDDAVVFTDAPLDEYEFLTDKFKNDPINLPEQSLPGGSEEIEETQVPQSTKDVQILSDGLQALFTFDLGSAGFSGSIPGDLLSDSLEGLSGEASAKKEHILSVCSANSAVYQQAQNITGVSWPVIAAIHYREGGCGSDRSVVSGEIIGVRNPDRRASECAGSSDEIGVPKKVPGGCGFTSLLDSAVFAANHLKGKIGGRVPSSLPDLALSLGNYNGTGNRNCGKTPYSNCPPKFDNDDHNYAMALLDGSHERMFIVYCANGVRCSPPKPERRPGAVTVVRLLTGK